MKNALNYDILCTMKKAVYLAIASIFCCLTFAACNNNVATTDYVATEKYCVVSLPQEYDIFYDNEEPDAAKMFDKDLYNAKTVNGKPKKEGFRYYNVLKNKPFRILTPLGIIQNQNANNHTLLYWKLNDALYKDGDNYYSENAFTCVNDTEITPVYYEFRAVGMMLFEADENGMSTVQDDEIFDDNGNIKEQDGLYYLYGVYDFEPYREFWRTNLTVGKFVINRTTQTVAENYSKDFYTLNIEIDKGNLFDKGKIIVVKLYKTDGHGYMIYGAGQVINGNHSDAVRTLQIGKHELKYTFS